MFKHQKIVKTECHACPILNYCIPPQLGEESIQGFSDLIQAIYVIKKSEHVYYQEEPVKYVFVVYTGCIKEYLLSADGEEKIHHFYLPGDFLSPQALADERYTFSSVAVLPSQLCAIPKEKLLLLMTSSPHLLQQFIRVLQGDLKEYEIPRTTNAKSRVAAFLLMSNRLFNRFKKPKEEENHFKLPMSQLDVANYLGIAHETVSRILHFFRDRKIIFFQRDEFYIRDPFTLENFTRRGV